jgi:hypothetical protein
MMPRVKTRRIGPLDTRLLMLESLRCRKTLGGIQSLPDQCGNNWFQSVPTIQPQQPCKEVNIPMVRKPQFYILGLSKGNLICGMRVLPVRLRIFSAFGPYPDYRRCGYI